MQGHRDREQCEKSNKIEDIKCKKIQIKKKMGNLTRCDLMCSPMRSSAKQMCWILPCHFIQNGFLPGSCVDCPKQGAEVKVQTGHFIHTDTM